MMRMRKRGVSLRVPREAMMPRMSGQMQAIESSFQIPEEQAMAPLFLSDSQTSLLPTASSQYSNGIQKAMWSPTKTTNDKVCLSLILGRLISRTNSLKQIALSSPNRLRGRIWKCRTVREEISNCILAQSLRRMT